MKNLKYLLSLSLIISSFTFAAEEEEVRTMEKDGILYNINNSSLHITPSDNEVSKVSDDMNGASKLVNKEESKDENSSSVEEPCCSCAITVSIGTMTALGDEGDTYDPGTSLSLKVPTPWAFDLFGKNWKVSSELNLSNLSSINGDDLNINAGIAHFDPSFDLPVNIDFGLGIAHTGDLGGLSGTGTLDVSYSLPMDTADLSLGFRYQKFVDVLSEDPYLDFGLLDTYSFTLSFSK